MHKVKWDAKVNQGAAMLNSVMSDTYEPPPKDLNLWVSMVFFIAATGEETKRRETVSINGWTILLDMGEPCSSPWTTQKDFKRFLIFTGSKLISIWGGCPGYPQVSVTGEIPEEPLSLGCHLGLKRASCWDAPAESLLLPVPIWDLPPGGHMLPRRSWAPRCWFDGSQQCYQRWSWAVKWNIAVPPSVHKAILFAMLPQCNNDSVYEKA